MHNIWLKDWDGLNAFYDLSSLFRIYMFPIWYQELSYSRCFVVLNNQYDFVMCDGQTSDFLGVGDIL